jgi:hypothetical protein
MSTLAHDDDDDDDDVSKQVSPGQQSLSLPSPVQGIQQLSAASSIDVPQKSDVLLAVADGTVGSVVSPASSAVVVVAEAVASSSSSSSVVAQVTTAAQSHMPPEPTAPLNNSPGGQLW